VLLILDFIPHSQGYVQIILKWGIFLLLLSSCIKLTLKIMVEDYLIPNLLLLSFRWNLLSQIADFQEFSEISS